MSGMVTDKEFDWFVLQVGMRIGYYRRRAGMTQEALAEKTGYAKSHIGQIESPNIVCNVSLKALYKIAKVLGVTVSKLTNIEDD